MLCDSKGIPSLARYVEAMEGPHSIVVKYTLCDICVVSFFMGVDCRCLSPSRLRVGRLVAIICALVCLARIRSLSWSCVAGGSRSSRQSGR